MHHDIILRDNRYCQTRYPWITATISCLLVCIVDNLRCLDEEREEKDLGKENRIERNRNRNLRSALTQLC